MEQIAAAVMSLAEKYFDNFRIRNGQVVVKTCPFCHGGENHDTDTFAVGLYNGAYSCLRGSCGAKGSFRELCEYYGMNHESYDTPRPIGSKEKTYTKPDPDALLPITETISTYFAMRRISEETVKAFRIAADEHGNIVFPFYENGVLTYVKYRKPKKFVKDDGPKEWQMKDTKPILFGMDLVSFNKPLIITEGEIDAMSLYEAGVSNAVSVPAGCKNMEWVTNCWDWLEHFQQIILFGDSDEPGTEMMNILMRRLGEDRCMLAPAYPQLVHDNKDYGRPCKDANEILFCYGPEALADLVKQCEPAPIKGVLNLASVPFIDPTTTPRIFTRVPELDNIIGGLGEGEITIFSGKRGEGKSTLSGQLLLNAIQQDYKVCAYSGELSAYKFLEWIFLQATESKYVGVRSDPRTGKQFAMVSPQIQERIREFLDGKFFLFDNAYVTEETQTDAIMKVFTTCARRYGCKLFLVDNLMSSLCSPDEENKAQARFVSMLKAFAVRFKVHVLLVAHPRKTKPGEVFSNDDISGSSAISNLADTVINVERPNLRITKNRNFGTLGFIECNFNPANRRIFQASYGDRTIYGWNHEDIAEPEVAANTLEEFKIQLGCPQQPF